MEIPSQDFISEFHLLFQQRIHLDFWWSYSPTATSSDSWRWYRCSFTGQMIRYFWIYTLFALSFYTQNVKIYSESFHVRFVQRGDLWKQTTRQLQMGYIILTQKTTLPSFNYLVVPLNKYSKQDLIEKNDELSLIFLINQLQNSSEFHALKDIPKEYTDHLTENT